MHLNDWRNLIRSEKEKLVIMDEELLDEIENHFDIPAREFCETDQALFGRWLIEAVNQNKMALSDYNMVRRRLDLKDEMPPLHKVAG